MKDQSQEMAEHSRPGRLYIASQNKFDGNVRSRNAAPSGRHSACLYRGVFRCVIEVPVSLVL
jgi:hypothetical protein